MHRFNPSLIGMFNQVAFDQNRHQWQTMSKISQFWQRAYYFECLSVNFYSKPFIA
jgi:hypothetical protein